MIATLEASISREKLMKSDFVPDRMTVIKRTESEPQAEERFLEPAAKILSEMQKEKD